MNKNDLKVEYYPEINDSLIKEANQTIRDSIMKWNNPFFTDSMAFLNIEKIKQITSQITNDDLKNIIVLGTGGSIQTLLAIKHLSKKVIYPITSSRAVELRNCLEATTPENSIVIPISRGGETLDVNSTIGVFFKRGYRFLGLSSKGMMNSILKEINCPILDVPDLSGRFSGSMTNVGIVPAYISGVNIKDFINGLDEGYAVFMNSENSIALRFAAYLFNLYKKGYKVIFSMPYSENLEGCVGLFVQEISESTGKDGKGFMSAYQPAPLCQHSVLEYLLGGTKEIVVPIIWTVNNESSDITLESSIDYVNGQSAQTIVNYQADATFQALIEQGVPSVKISIDAPSEKFVGLLIAFIQSTVYYLCLLMDINWANNPKVVIGKEICNEALKNKIPPKERKKNRQGIANNVFKDDYN